MKRTTFLIGTVCAYLVATDVQNTYASIYRTNRHRMPGN